MKSFFAALLLTFIAASVYAEDKVVAVVGDKTITLEDFNKRYEDVRKQAANPPAKKIFLEDLVRFEIGVQEAEKRGLARDPMVAERLRQELYKGLLEKDLGKDVAGIKVNDKEMAAYYSKNPEVRTQHILIEVKPGATAVEKETAKKRADELFLEVKGSKRKFEELVTLYTDDISTKKNGGDIGYQNKLSIYPTYYEAAQRMKIGQVSGLVETPFGFHIVRLTGVNSYKDANKRQVRYAVFEEKRLKIFNDYFKKVKGRYKTTVNETLLN